MAVFQRRISEKMPTCVVPCRLREILSQLCKILKLLFKDYSSLGVHYRDLQARVHEQETRNLTLHEAQPSAVLNFEFLVRERVLVNPIMHEQRVLKTF